MNRDHVSINWKFTRKMRHQKFGYKMDKINYVVRGLAGGVEKLFANNGVKSDGREYAR